MLSTTEYSTSSRMLSNSLSACMSQPHVKTTRLIKLDLCSRCLEDHGFSAIGHLAKYAETDSPRNSGIPCTIKKSTRSVILQWCSSIWGGIATASKVGTRGAAALRVLFPLRTATSVPHMTSARFASPGVIRQFLMRLCRKMEPNSALPGLPSFGKGLWRHLLPLLPDARIARIAFFLGNFGEHGITHNIVFSNIRVVYI